LSRVGVEAALGHLDGRHRQTGRDQARRHSQLPAEPRLGEVERRSRRDLEPCLNSARGLVDLAAEPTALRESLEPSAGKRNIFNTLSEVVPI
jgi:hypothetical protein